MTKPSLADRLRGRIRDVPDFPSPGILFRDITPVLADPSMFRDVVGHFCDHFADIGADAVVAVESRGFILGAPLANALDVSFVPIRKPGKLPWQTVRAEYQLEYGSDALEAHMDAIESGQRVILIDDVLATGGTAAAAASLIAALGGTVAGCGFLIELAALGGRSRLDGLDTESILIYS